MKGDGGTPYELVEWDIARETGWTLDELDQQDAARVLPMIRLANTRAALYRVRGWLDTQGKAYVSDEDWKIYAEANEAMKANG